MTLPTVQSNGLGKRFAIYILMFSSLVTLVSTIVQIGFEYRSDVGEIEKQLNQIQESYSESLANSLWDASKNDAELQLSGILRLRDMKYVEARNEQGEVYAKAGIETINRSDRRHEFPLTFTKNKKAYSIGNVHVVASLDGTFVRLRDRILTILITQTIKTFLVSFFILYLFQVLIGQHLKMLAKQTKNLENVDGGSVFILERKNSISRAPDELDDVTHALNEMTHRVLQSLMTIEKNRNQLNHINEHLEQLVIDRTEKLAATMVELSKSNQMASLGKLVAGISHELNTPVGNILVSSSTLHDLIVELDELMNVGKVSRTQLNTAVANCKQGAEIIQRSANRANDLIMSFKEIAMGQNSELSRCFRLRDAVTVVANTYKASAADAGVVIDVRIPAEIIIDSYAGHIETILKNLILNSIKHGYSGDSRGIVVIDAKQEVGAVTIIVQDDGCGIPPELINKVFEPFFTTKFGQGGSGLGLTIIYNLIHLIFKGNITLNNNDSKGIRVEFRLPLTT